MTHGSFEWQFAGTHGPDCGARPVLAATYARRAGSVAEGGWGGGGWGGGGGLGLGVAVVIAKEKTFEIFR